MSRRFPAIARHTFLIMCRWTSEASFRRLPVAAIRQPLCAWSTEKFSVFFYAPRRGGCDRVWNSPQNLLGGKGKTQ